MKKRILSLLTACVLLLGTTPAAFAALSNFISERSYAGQFTDVPASAWYYENVKTAYELGLVNGSSASTYSPDDNITVAEVQTLVARIHSTYYGNTIAPVSGAWYTPYIEYCIEHIDREICSMAYMQDGGRAFADTPASRTYFAYLMYAALPYSEYTQINTIVNGALPDVDDIVFMDADTRIYTLYRAGILTGSDTYGTFNPDTNITRAEVAAIVSRMIDPTQRISFTLQEKPQTISLDAYLGDWYFNQYPDSGLSIEKIGDEYYLSLTVVQGNGLRFNGTMEPARLIDQGSYFATAPFFTMQATTAVAQIRPQGSQLVVSCTEEGTSGLSLNMSGAICSRR